MPHTEFDRIFEKCVQRIKENNLPSSAGPKPISIEEYKKRQTAKPQPNPKPKNKKRKRAGRSVRKRKEIATLYQIHKNQNNRRKFKMILIIIMLIPAISHAMQPTLNLRVIGENNGYAIIKTKERPIIDNYLKVLHVFNITEIEQSAYNVKQAIDIIMTDRHDTMTTLIGAEYNNLVHNIETITPYRRQKRGIINFMGKASKYIYGTMDNDDAEEIYAHLNNLDSNIKNVITATNEQVEINNNLLKIAEEIKNHTNKQTKDIKQYLYDMKTMTNRISKNEEDMRRTFELYLTIQKLNRLVEKLADIILLSRLNVLAHNNNKLTFHKYKYNIRGKINNFCTKNT